jgi:NAD(P)-dependent dehydrogenase (short-subunit alcohol dehydrogenase family)
MTFINKVVVITGAQLLVNISSTRSIMSEGSSEAYAASKGAILALTHAMALQAVSGLRRMLLEPAFI